MSSILWFVKTSLTVKDNRRTMDLLANDHTYDQVDKPFRIKSYRIVFDLFAAHDAVAVTGQRTKISIGCSFRPLQMYDAEITEAGYPGTWFKAIRKNLRFKLHDLCVEIEPPPYLMDSLVPYCKQGMAIKKGDLIAALVLTRNANVVYSTSFETVSECVRETIFVPFDGHDPECRRPRLNTNTYDVYPFYLQTKTWVRHDEFTPVDSGLIWRNFDSDIFDMYIVPIQRLYSKQKFPYEVSIPELNFGKTIFYLVRFLGSKPVELLKGATMFYFVFKRKNVRNVSGWIHHNENDEIVGAFPTPENSNVFHTIWYKRPEEKDWFEDSLLAYVVPENIDYEVPPRFSMRPQPESEDEIDNAFRLHSMGDTLDSEVHTYTVEEPDDDMGVNEWDLMSSVVANSCVNNVLEDTI